FHRVRIERTLEGPRTRAERDALDSFISLLVADRLARSLPHATLDPTRDRMVRKQPLAVVRDGQAGQVLRQLPDADVSLRHEDGHHDDFLTGQLVLELDDLTDAAHGLRADRLRRVVPHQAELHVAEAASRP